MDSLKRRSKSFPRESLRLQEELSPIPMELGETPPRTNETERTVLMERIEEDVHEHDTVATPKTRPKKQIHRKGRKKLVKHFKPVFVFCMMFLTLLASWYLLSAVEKCGKGPVRFHVEKLEEELQERIFGQNSSICYFLNKLMVFMEDDSANVMVTWLLGEQGVGKTLTADILSHIVQFGNVRKYFVPHDYPLRFSTKDIFNIIMSRLDPCQLSLIIFDDLQYLSADSKKQLLNFFTLFQHGDFHKKLLFVLVSHEGSDRIRSLVSQNPEAECSEISEMLLEENEIPSLTFFQSITDYLVVVPFYPIRTKDALKCVSGERGEDRVIIPDTGTFLDGGCKRMLSHLKRLQGGVHI